MRLSEIQQQTTTTPMTARIQHIEDLAIWDGVEGTKRALSLFNQMQQSVANISVKWDGSPGIIFGRDEHGKFTLTDKAGFYAKNYNGKPNSASELQSMLLNRKNVTVDESRRQFAANMARVFDVFEQATPAGFKGYVFGDLMYYTLPPVTNGQYVFKPNLVTYKVDTRSPIGARIKKSTAGVVLHHSIRYDGARQMLKQEQFDTDALFVLRPVFMRQPASINSDYVSKCESLIGKYNDDITELLNDDTLRYGQMADFKQVLYSYINHLVKINKLTNIGSSFGTWLTDTSKVSAVKRVRMFEHIKTYQSGFSALFGIIETLMALKNDVISQLDQRPPNGVHSFIGSTEGGEGYVIGTGEAKLVNRGLFSNANMTKDM
jgi:hypothetical protein